MRTSAKLIVILALVFVAVGTGLWLSVGPPSPMPLPETGATLSGVTVINPGVHHLAGKRLVIENDTIASMEDDSSTTGPYAGAYVLPGLIDMHVHFPPSSVPGSTELFAFLFLYHGVTAVRDAGDIDGTATEPVRRAAATGAFPTPRTFSCGPFVDGEGARWPNSRIVRTVQEVAPVVAEIAKDYDCVKAYDGLTPEVALALHEAARRRGIRVIGHVPRGLRFEDAPVDDVQHMMGMAFAEGEEGPFPRSMQAWRKVDEARIGQIVNAAIARGVAITPTLIVLERLSRMDDSAALSRETDARRLPRYFREIVWSPDPSLTAEDYSGMRDAVRTEQRVVRRLYEAGANLHMGTDALNPFVVPGASMHREMALYVQAGLTPEEAWAVATRWNGAALPPRFLGRIRVGAPADLLVFREDPTVDLAALSTLEAVIAGGRLYSREALETQMERYRRHMNGFLFDRISVALVRRALANLSPDAPEGS